MAQVIHVTILGDETSATAADKYIKGATLDREGISALANHLLAMVAGVKNGVVTVKVEDGSSTAASQTVTGTASAASADTLVVGGVTFTTRTTVVTPTHVALGASAVSVATNLASAINAYSAFVGNLTAATSTSICTITAWSPGRVGNFVTLTETGDGYTLGGATLSGGTGTSEAAPRTYNAGK